MISFTQVSELKELRKGMLEIAAANGETEAKWLGIFPAVLPTNRDSVPIRAVGLGLEKFYDPNFARNFRCTWASVGGDVVTEGVAAKSIDTDGVSYISITCPSPAGIKKKSSFALAIDWLDAAGASEVRRPPPKFELTHRHRHP